MPYFCDFKESLYFPLISTDGHHVSNEQNAQTSPVFHYISVFCSFFLLLCDPAVALQIKDILSLLIILATASREI